MTMIKSYTNLEQSKKLAEILTLESADMFYADLFVDNKHQYIVHPLETYGFKTFKDTNTRTSKRLSFIPCWSLAALFEIIPNASLHKTFSGRRCDSYNTEGKSCILGETTDSPIDACVAMVEKLHELKIL